MKHFTSNGHHVNDISVSMASCCYGSDEVGMPKEKELTYTFETFKSHRANVMLEAAPNYDYKLVSPLQVKDFSLKRRASLENMFIMLQWTSNADQAFLSRLCFYDLPVESIS